MGIVLLGYRGCGKSTAARLLADQLRLPVLDTDERVIELAGMTIREIFEQRGEPAFRALEATAVRESLANESIVIALGGGVILQAESRELLQRSNHLRIYLRCEARVLHDRIHADPQTAHNRPSLTHLGGNIGEIEHLLAQREPLYREVMTHEVDVTHLLPEATSAAIVALLE